MSKQGKWKKSVLELLLWISSLVVLVPLFLALINSFKTAREADLLRFSLPEAIRFENYLKVLVEGKMLNAFKNGIIISGSTTLLVMAFSSIAAFALQRRKSRLNRFFYLFFSCGMIYGVSIIPTIKVMQVLQIMNTVHGIVLLYSAFLMGFCVFIYQGFYSTITREIDEAAIIDGSSPLTLFMKVIFPLLKPVHTTVVVIVFSSVWNDFQFPLYFLSNSKNWTVPMTIYGFFGKFSSQWNLVFADIIVAIAPILLIYFLAQKYIVSGLTAGAVKA